MPLPVELIQKRVYGYTKNDFTDAYNQIKLAAVSQHSTHHGVRLQQRLPFGIN